MAATRTGVLDRLCKVALARDGCGLSDGQLLERYVAGRDEAAFEALVRRHGPMVWGVVRRVAGNGPDAEDAFQATFLVLVRKAASLRSRELVGNWLYGVAYRTALKARCAAARRRARERQVEQMPHPEVGPDEAWSDLQPLLDRELERLPDKYRVPLVLCELEGRGRKEVARQLRLPEGTLSSRLATARRLLAARLTRRGLTLSAAALTAALSHQAAPAGVPRALIVSTVNVAKAARRATAAGAVPASVSALTDGVLKGMLMRKLKLTTALLLGAAVLSVTATAARQARARRPDEEGKKAVPVQDVNAAPKTEKPPWVPDRPMPVPVLAQLGKDGKVTVHVSRILYVQRTEVDKGGAQRTVVEPTIAVSLRVIDANDVRAFDTRGKQMPPKALARALKKQVLAVAYTNGKGPDPQHLRLIREGTLILVLPGPDDSLPVFAPPPPAGFAPPVLAAPPAGATPPPPPVPSRPSGPLFEPPPAPATPHPGGAPVPPPAPDTPPVPPAPPAPAVPATPPPGR
jgi:RNA polymerase sigma factor (sigma-70 family)